MCVAGGRVGVRTGKSVKPSASCSGRSKLVRSGPACPAETHRRMRRSARIRLSKTGVHRKARRIFGKTGSGTQDICAAGVLEVFGSTSHSLVDVRPHLGAQFLGCRLSSLEIVAPHGRPSTAYSTNLTFAGSAVKKRHSPHSVEGRGSWTQDICRSSGLF